MPLGGFVEVRVNVRIVQAMETICGEATREEEKHCCQHHHVSLPTALHFRPITFTAQKGGVDLLMLRG